MAQRTGKSSSNRYKKNGKGPTTLAVFLVTIILVMLGAYYFFDWKAEQKLPANQTALQRNMASSEPKTPKEASPSISPPLANVQPQQEKTVDTQWEHYTEDTAGEEREEKTTKTNKSVSKKYLAIIIDDMGSSINDAKELASIGVPLTFSIIPGLRSDRDVAAFAADNGIEVMIHMPMQSKEYPMRRLEKNGLLLEQDDNEIKSRVHEYMTLLPQAVGANNHMGSGFTEDATKMRLVLSILKNKGMYYVDSVTTPNTMGPGIARGLGLRSGKRDVFLDNEKNYDYIKGQLSKATERARRTGYAIAICHPHPATIATLSKTLPELRKQGVTLVTASRIVR